MDIAPPNQHPATSDDELAKVLAGIGANDSPDKQAANNQSPAEAAGLQFEETPGPIPAGAANVNNPAPVGPLPDAAAPVAQTTAAGPENIGDRASDGIDGVQLRLEQQPCAENADRNP